MVKGEVCKTSIQRFESARRLQLPNAQPEPEGMPRATLQLRRSGGIGRRSGLKLRGPQGRVGSNPSSGTSVPGGPPQTKSGPLARPAYVQPATSLELLPDQADGRVQIAAEEHQSSDSENCDQRKNECVFRETLAFLATKGEEQGGLLSPETACRPPGHGWLRLGLVRRLAGRRWRGCPPKRLARNGGAV